MLTPYGFTNEIIIRYYNLSILLWENVSKGRAEKSVEAREVLP
jgi:hypothetical protein